MIEIKFPSENKALAAAIGSALLQYGQGKTPAVTLVETTTVGDVSHSTEKVAVLSADDNSGLSADEKQELTQALETDTAAEEQKAKEAAAAAQQQTAANAPVDERGVPHNPAFCVGVKADKPFYATGKEAGQWKTGRGVDKAAYEAWYNAELSKLAATTPATEAQADPAPAANTAAAFGAQQSPAVDPPPAAAGATTFENAGHFMQWMAEYQAAGTITQQDVERAYAETGVQATAMFNPATADESIKKIYDHLCANVEGVK